MASDLNLQVFLDFIMQILNKQSSRDVAELLLDFCEAKKNVSG